MFYRMTPTQVNAFFDCLTDGWHLEELCSVYVLTRALTWAEVEEIRVLVEGKNTGELCALKREILGKKAC